MAGRFPVELGIVVAAGFALRVAYVLAHRHTALATDAFYYHVIASFLTHGDGFVNPINGVATAVHPPAWVVMLSLPSLLGVTSVLGQQLFACFVGTATVTLVGIAGRTIAGARAGIIAAAIAALYPNLWIWERELAAETLVLPLVACALILAYRFHARPRLATFLTLAVVCAVLTLTRSEEVLLFFVLLVPLAASAKGVSHRRAAAWLVAAALTAAVLMTPWTVYNASRFKHPVLLDTSLGLTIAYGTNPMTYNGARIGSVDPTFWAKGLGRQTGDESQVDIRSRDQAVTYASKHLTRLPVVAAAREGRTWDLFRVSQGVSVDRGWGHDSVWVYWIAIGVFWLLIPVGVFGALILRSRRTMLFPLLAPFLIVALTSATTYGEPRFRASAEVPLVLLAAVGIDAALFRLRRSRSSAINSVSASTSGRFTL